MRKAAGMLLSGLLLALLGLLATAGPASAHAQLDQTTPTQGGEVQALPAAVTLSFGEGVSVNPRSLQVLDPDGGRVDTGVVTHPGGRSDTVAVGLRGGLAPASYTVVWKVVSADSHPVSGTFAFGYRVPAGAATAADVGGSPLVGAIDAAARFTSYAGVVLLVGGAAFLWGLWPGGAALRRPRRLLAAGWATTAASALVLLVVAGPYSNGLGLASVTDTGLLSEELDTRYAKLLLARLLLLALAVPVLRRLTARAGEAGRDRGQAFDLAGLGATLLLTFSLAEHAGVGRQVPLSVATDALHLAASSTWVGGLVLLAVSLLGAEHAGELRAVLPRWSRWAMASVAVIAVTGAYQSWRDVGTLPAFTATTYGVLLLVKTGGFMLLLALGDLGRRWVLRHAGSGRPVALAAASLDTAPAVLGARTGTAPTAVQVRTLRRSVGLEVVIAAAVLALTAVLVNSVPARDSYSAPHSATVTAQGTSGPPISITVDVTSTRRGVTTVHAYTYDSVGRVLPVDRIDLQLADTAGRYAPVRAQFTPAGPGHLTAYDVIVPAAGEWTMTLQVKQDATTAYAGAFSYAVR